MLWLAHYSTFLGEIFDSKSDTHREIKRMGATHRPECLERRNKLQWQLFVIFGILFVVITLYAYIRWCVLMTSRFVFHVLILFAFAHRFYSFGIPVWWSLVPCWCIFQNIHTVSRGHINSTEPFERLINFLEYRYIVNKKVERERKKMNSLRILNEQIKCIYIYKKRVQKLISKYRGLRYWCSFNFYKSHIFHLDGSSTRAHAN